ncbi:MAG TPA: tetratricopeptide repeat protein, partial [Balneolaceae bacterium]|nr:tetratricopeptide repeat protein [Balneolaceae bacterium]
MKIALSNVRKITLSTLIFFSVAIAFQACSKKKSTKKVDTSSANYRKAVSAFYVSLAAEETDHLNFAVNHMIKVTKLYPDEPAAWANLGVMALQQGNFKFAQKKLENAQKKAPKNADIEFLIGLMKSRQGNIKEALKALKKAQNLDPSNAKILYKRAEELERQDVKTNADQVESLLQKILKKHPE